MTTIGKSITKPYLEDIELDIIIPAWNESEQTVRCIRSLRAHSSNYRLIVIDNGSRSEEWAAVAAELTEQPDNLYFRNDINLGFVKAVNLGLARSTAHTIALINNDIEVPPGWQRRLLDDMHRSGFDLIGPLSSARQGRQFIGTVLPDTALPWRHGEPSTAELAEINARLQQSGQPPVEIRDRLAFFCVILKRAVMEKTGYLSEEFGIGFGDDDDYCIRVRQAGFRIGLSRTVMVRHEHRTTFNRAFSDEMRRRMQNHNIALLRAKYPHQHWPDAK